MDSRLLVPHRNEIKEEMKNTKKKEKMLVNKNDPQSLENEGSFKIDLLFLNFEFS